MPSVMALRLCAGPTGCTGKFCCAVISRLLVMSSIDRGAVVAHNRSPSSYVLPLYKVPRRDGIVLAFSVWRDVFSPERAFKCNWLHHY